MEQHLEENTWSQRTTVNLDVTEYHLHTILSECTAHIWEPPPEREGSMTIITTNYVHKFQKIVSKWRNNI
jgi:hypothetical protein